MVDELYIIKYKDMSCWLKAEAVMTTAEWENLSVSDVHTLEMVRQPKVNNQKRLNLLICSRKQFRWIFRHDES